MMGSKVIQVLSSIFGSMAALAIVAGCGSMEPEKKLLPDDRKPVINEVTTGGQPGEVSLQGVIVGDEKKASEGLAPKIQVEILGGVGKHGERAPVLSAQKLKVSQKADSDYLKLVTSEMEHVNKSSYMQLGCGVPEFSWLLEPIATELMYYPAPFNNSTSDSQDERKLQVDSLLICGKLDLPLSRITRIHVRTLVLASADVQNEGRMHATKHLEIIAENIVLHGDNQIRSYRREGLQSQPGPNMQMVVTGQIYGDGKLKIVSEGAKYLAAPTNVK